MELTSEFATDSKKEVEGVWCRFSHDAEARIARRNNKNHREFVRNATLPYMRGGSVSVPDNAMMGILKEATANHILLELRGNWTIVNEDTGKEEKLKSKLAPAVLIKLFDRLPEFYETVLTFSANVELYREDRIRDTVGN